MTVKYPQTVGQALAFGWEHRKTFRPENGEKSVMVTFRSPNGNVLKSFYILWEMTPEGSVGKFNRHAAELAPRKDPGRPNPRAKISPKTGRNGKKRISAAEYCRLKGEGLLNKKPRSGKSATEKVSDRRKGGKRK